MNWLFSWYHTSKIKSSEKYFIKINVLFFRKLKDGYREKVASVENSTGPLPSGFTFPNNTNGSRQKGYFPKYL